jgi:hypothetical protein
MTLMSWWAMPSAAAESSAQLGMAYTTSGSRVRST